MSAPARRDDHLPFADPQGDRPDPSAPSTAEFQTLDRRQRAASISALWAAWADAVGWISELVDEDGLKRRTDGRELRGPLRWTRKIGGRGGVNVDLPAGTYSDDTQLRLAVGRAYGQDGFDAEAFSAVELTVWPSYALGGGLGTKAAAASMAKPGAHWAANRPANYLDSGGNGAAMRSQPHAWHTVRPSTAVLRDVMRDAVSTHGHPRGIVGAAVNALAVADSLPGGAGALAAHGTEAWNALIGETRLLAAVAQNDAELSAYWLPHWLHPELGPWDTALAATLVEMQHDAHIAAKVVGRSSDLATGYAAVVEQLHLRESSRRGSGTLTVLAALALVALARRHDSSITPTLLCAVNALGTDTDTIATIAAGILGCGVSEIPDGVLDRHYIATEAARIAAPGRPGPSRSSYPDLLTWEPPRSQADALMDFDGTLVVSGLGLARALSEPITQPRGDFAWQWVQLQSTQTMLVKRRATLPSASPSSVPRAAPTRRSEPTPSSTVATSAPKRTSRNEPEHRPAPPAAAPEGRTLEGALAAVRESNYSSHVIGAQLIRLARDVSPAVAAAFGALVATDVGTFLRDRGQSRQ